MSMTNKPDSAIMAADRAALERRIDHGDLRHLLAEKKRTHVIVGDHPPEPRVVHDWHGNIPVGTPDDGTGRWRDI